MGINHYPSSVEAELAELRQRIAALEGAPLLQNSIIVEPGTLEVRTKTNIPTMYVGYLTGSQPQMGFYFARDSGEIALSVARGADTDPSVPQNVGMYDVAGNQIIADDVVSGQGLARPYIPYGALSAKNPPDSTSTALAGAYEILLDVVGVKHNPNIYVSLLVSLTAGQTGTVQLTDAYSGAVLASQDVVGTGNYTYIDVIVPAPGNLYDRVIVHVQATISGGTLSARLALAYGRQS